MVSQNMDLRLMSRFAKAQQVLIVAVILAVSLTEVASASLDTWKNALSEHMALN